MSNFTVNQHNKIIYNVIVVSIFCYPGLLLTIRGGMSGIFFLLLAVALNCLYRQAGKPFAAYWDNHSIAFACAMASPVVSIFLSQAYHGEFSAPPYDGASRFLFAIPIFLAFRHMEIKIVNLLEYAFPVAVLVVFLVMLINPYDAGGRLSSAQFVNVIHFGDLVLALGALCLFTIHDLHQNRKAILIFKIFGLCAGIYLSFLSGSRGGWVAIPVFILIWGISISRQYVFRNLAFISIVLLSFSLLAYFFIDVVHIRIDSTYQNIRDFSVNPDTAIGIRLQQWNVAWTLFIANPIFGIGYSAFPDMMESMINRGLITEVAAGLARSEVHNELLAKAVGMGIFGLLSIISIHLVPLIIFLRSSDSENRVAPYMGICLVICFFVFGLTVEIFNLKMTASFYSLTIALLLAASINNIPRKCHHV